MDAFGHPEQDRAISVREAACLQTFPEDFVFHGMYDVDGKADRKRGSRSIGEAVVANGSSNTCRDAEKIVLMATFKTRARTLDMLGKQQIAGMPTAISELFKNAHDAYADRVEIDYYRSDGLFVLRDDGVGMSKDDFVSRWLTIGTESKFDPSRRPPQHPDKEVRPMLGEKGIGRLAIATIGPQLLVLTRPKSDEGASELTAAFLNWGISSGPGSTWKKSISLCDHFRQARCRRHKTWPKW